MLAVVEVGSRSIGEEDVIVGVALDGFGEVPDSFFPLLLLEGRVAQGLERSSFFQVSHKIFNNIVPEHS